jgi:hypothetical protein
MHITIELPFKVETHQAGYEADESEHPGGYIHDKRPSPWPPSSIDLPFKVKSSEEFPSNRGVNGNCPRQRRDNSHVNPSTDM